MTKELFCGAIGGLMGGCVCKCLLARLLEEDGLDDKVTLVEDFIASFGVGMAVAGVASFTLLIDANAITDLLTSNN